MTEIRKSDCCQSLENLHLIDKMNFEDSWKVDYGFGLPSSKGFNSFLYGPSGMKLGTCLKSSLEKDISDVLYFDLLWCKLKFCSECPINFVTENKN